MEKLAYRKVLLTASKSYRYNFDGPLKTNKSDFVEFVWYKELPFNDSAIIYIEVPLVWNPFENKNIKVTMNSNWAYLEGAMSSFGDISPFNTPEKIVIQVDKQNENIPKIKMLVSADKILYDIEKGFFEILKRTSSSSVISFYKPIVELEEINGAVTKFIPTSSAIISVIDSTEISLTPIPEVIARQ
ncbi:MAG: hypothetical protein QNK35_16545 [Bacteroides sp.]|nr:hypothetical protein [Bacteroides sp.]